MFQRTTLYSHKELPTRFISGGDFKSLASSGFQIPLCWLLLFDAESLRSQKVFNLEGEQTCEYSTLISDKESALARYQAAAQRFKSLLGQRCDTYFDYWHQYLTYNAEDYLHLDATALWMNGDEQAYVDNLQLSLSGIAWVMSDQCAWQRSWLESLPLFGKAFDPMNKALQHVGVKHLLAQSGVLDAGGEVYIDKTVLQGEI